MTLCHLGQAQASWVSSRAGEPSKDCLDPAPRQGVSQGVGPEISLDLSTSTWPDGVGLAELAVGLIRSSRGVGRRHSFLGSCRGKVTWGSTPDPYLDLSPA